MNGDEIKAHRIAVATALADGKQGQVQQECKWVDADPDVVAAWLYATSGLGEVRTRIKPEPRKCWVGWFTGNSEPAMAWTASGRLDCERRYNGPIKWQLVQEDIS